jgi:hypothetical protein
LVKLSIQPRGVALWEDGGGKLSRSLGKVMLLKVETSHSIHQPERLKAPLLSV